jgi:hypothetical protein
MSVQEANTEPSPPLSPRPRRHGRILGTLAAVLLVVALVVAGLLFFDHRPVQIPTIFLRFFPLHIVLITIFALMVTGFAVRWRRRITLAMAVAALLVSATAAITPMISVANTAFREGSSVSLGDYLSNGFRLNMGSPDESKSVLYASPDGHPLSLDVWPAADRREGKAVVLIHGGAWKEGTRG